MPPLWIQEKSSHLEKQEHPLCLPLAAVALPFVVVVVVVAALMCLQGKAVPWHLPWHPKGGGLEMKIHKMRLSRGVDYWW